MALLGMELRTEHITPRHRTGQRATVIDRRQHRRGIGRIEEVAVQELESPGEIHPFQQR